MDERWRAYQTTRPRAWRRQLNRSHWYHAQSNGGLFISRNPRANEVDEELTALRSEMGAQTQRPVQTAATALEGADTKVHCPSEREVGPVGEGDPSLVVAVETSSAPAHQRGAPQPRSVPVFTGAPSGNSADEGGYLATPVPGSPRAGTQASYAAVRS